MSLLPSKYNLEDQKFAELIDVYSITDFSVVNIDPLNCDERLLPHLAVSEDVDISGLSVDEARIYIYNAKEIKRYAGTVYAVEQSINVCFEDGQLKEWFEAGLEKGLFDVEVKLKADSSLVYLPSKFDKAKQMIRKSKNVRSKLNAFKISFPNGEGVVEKSEAMNFKIDLDSKLGCRDIDTQVSAITGAEFDFVANTTKNLQDTPVVCTNNFIGGAEWRI